MRAYKRNGGSSPLILNLGQLHTPAILPPGKSPGDHLFGGWVGPRGGFDVLEETII
jgi:hypothetical protein